MNKEDFFIKQFSNNKYIGDDGAVVGEYIYSMDAFFENVHFKKEWMSLEEIAYKSMLVNISDAIVMNAKPLYALLSVAIPQSYTRHDLIELSKGFKKAAEEFNLEIIGGDTICNNKLDISITIVSHSKKPSLRKGLKKGDLLCYTGELGSCAKDLNKLFKNKKISKNSKFIKPKLKPSFFYEASKYMSASLDISDGLFFELERLSKINKLGFEFFSPISKDVGESGEEYEILFSFPKKHQKKIQKIAKKHKVKLNIFAKAKKGKYRTKSKNHHF
jgi:thiamine-monophosphate kinase